MLRQKTKTKNKKKKQHKKQKIYIWKTLSYGNDLLL